MGMVLRAIKMVSEDNGGEERVDGHGSSSSITREEVLHYLGRVEESVTGRNGCHGPAYLHKIRDLYSIGTVHKEDSTRLL